MGSSCFVSLRLQNTRLGGTAGGKGESERAVSSRLQLHNFVAYHPGVNSIGVRYIQKLLVDQKVGIDTMELLNTMSDWVRVSFGTVEGKSKSILPWQIKIYKNLYL